MPSPVCVDASLIVTLLLSEEGSAEVEALLRQWAREGTSMTAPSLFRFEAASALRRRAYFERITTAHADRFFHFLQSLPIEVLTPSELLPEAWRLAMRFNRPTVYDTSYLALAELLDCELWTADRRFFNAARGGSHRLRWIGEKQR